MCRIAILEIGRELAVGKRARTTFTKLYVRPGVELARSKEGLHIVRALLHRRTLLNEKRFESTLRKIPSSEEPSRSCAYYHGRQVGRAKLRNLKRHIGSGWPNLQAFQLRILLFGSRKQTLFALGRQLQPIARGEMHVRFLARINAALQQLGALDRSWLHAELPSGLSKCKRLAIGQARIKRKLQT